MSVCSVVCGRDRKVGVVYAPVDKRREEPAREGSGNHL